MKDTCVQIQILQISKKINSQASISIFTDSLFFFFSGQLFKKPKYLNVLILKKKMCNLKKKIY